MNNTEFTNTIIDTLDGLSVEQLIPHVDAVVNLIAKLKYLSNSNNLDSADSMQGHLEAINDLLNEQFPEIVEYYEQEY